MKTELHYTDYRILFWTWTIWGSIPSRDKTSSLLQNIQISSGSLPASNSMGQEALFPLV